jgi:tRNA A37 methylthiotransferase MiaB
MEKYFTQNGWKIERDFLNSSLILFNACGLTESQENNSIRIIESITTQKKPDARLIVWGCLPKINSKRLSSVYQGPTFGSDEPHRISEIIDIKGNLDLVHANYLVPNTPLASANQFKWPNLNRLIDPLAVLRKLTEPAYRRYGKDVNLYGPKSYIIKTSTGCMSACTYCAVRISRGTVKSKSIERIKREFMEGLECGFTDFSLIATDVGSYGLDRGNNLADLLEQLTRIPGKYQLGIRNIQPKLLIKMLPDLKRIFKRGKISFIGATAQSGSDHVLKSMRRGYTIDEYKHAISALKEAYPKIKVRTQLMVGFPGETEQDFIDTLRLLDEVDFDYVETFIFQPRVGTIAAEMAGKISKKTAMKRHDRLVIKAINRFAGNLNVKDPKLLHKLVELLTA